MKKLIVLSVLALGLPFSVFAHCSAASHGGISVSDPWVRATVPQQRATGAFMTLTAKEGARLVAAASPAARVVEVHEMTLGADNVMRMRAIEALDLPPGQPVELKSGGYHVMLIDLVGQVKENDRVPLTLTFECPDGHRDSVEVEAVVRAQAHRAGGHGHH